MHKSKINKISLAVCLAFMPVYGLAAGLGKLNINSGLGEPLKAEIELLSVTPDELSTLSAAVASEEAYAVQGIPRLGIHNNIKVELIKNADGSPALRLRSQQPITDPYLDMLIQVDWASGRLLREYTLLLDPPEYKHELIEEPVNKATISKPVVTSNASVSDQPSSNSEVVSQAAPKSKKSKKSAARVSEPHDESQVVAGDTAEVTSQRGDTLNSIAKDVQVEGVSLDQMLVGLFEANKNAFVDGNMNRLKVGQILKVPSKEALTAIGSQQARKEVKVHSANWNAYRNNLAGNVLAAPVAEGTEQKQSASGKIAAAEDKAMSAKTGPQDVVKLSAGGKAPAGKTGADFDAKVLALQEEATAREQALKESQQRTAALETQIADMQKLLALKNQAMAGVQKNAETAAKPVENNPPAVTPPAPSVPTSPPAPAADTVAPADKNVLTASPAGNAAPVAGSADKPAAPAKTPQKTPPAAKAPVQPQPIAEPSFLESLLGSVDLLVLGGSAGIALLGIGWMYLRNKRRRDLDSFERGILTSGGLRANTVFGNTTGTTSTADTSFLTDFAQSADGSMIDTNDVDPIAEAEVYMAYGRDAQAEEILKDAISKEPKRYELHLKLLEMYAARKDISAFEAIAGELYTTLGADDPTWAKVAELGVMVEPDNPLYDVSQIPSSVATAMPESVAGVAPDKDLSLDSDLDFSFEDEPEAKTDIAGSIAMQTPESDVDHQFDVSNAEQAEKASFDLGDLKSDFSGSLSEEQIATENPESTSSLVAETKPTADNSMDFDFPDLGSFVSASQEQATEETQLADNSLSMPEHEMLSAEATAASQADAQEVELPASNSEQEVKNDKSDLDFNFTATPPTEIDLELPELASGADNFNFEGFDEIPASVNTEAPAISALAGIDLDFGTSEEPATQPEDIKLEEISFDIPLADDEYQPESKLEVDATNNEANNFDFSAISLDMTDAEPQTAEVAQADVTVTESAVATAENPDIDIKLDLVKVYIDMEDVEGARDLLDEVLKEGGPQQRAAAESLLASLT